jgi:hypothetical protein
LRFRAEAPINQQPDMPPSTMQILALRALRRSCGEECVAWAVSLLERGHDSRSLRILAGMTPPLNHFELSALRDRVLNELSPPELNDADPVTGYVREIVGEALGKPRQLGDVFREVSELSIALGYPTELRSFYLLRFAWEDLQARGDQRYWPGATRDNIEEVMLGEARRFVAGG